MNKAYEVLQRAASLAATGKWIQGEYHHLGGSCAMGFVYDAEVIAASSRGTGSVYSPANELGMKYIVPLIWEQYPEGDDSGEPWASVESWNDEPGRTKDEVVAILEKAAVRAGEAVA